MTKTLSDFLTIPYVDGGRDWTGLDCWGIVRAARYWLLNRPLLTSFGHIINNGGHDHYQGMTAAYHSLKNHYQEVQPVPGAIACCFNQDTLIHVGVVVRSSNILKVLHTRYRTGPHLTSIRNFNRLAVDVRYFDDCHPDNFSQ